MELRRNVVLSDASVGYPYERPGGGGSERKNPKRDRQAHAAKLSQELERAAKADIAAKVRGGTYLRFNSSAGYEMNADSFDNANSKIQLVNVRSTGGDEPIVSATVYVPQRSAKYFEKKVSDYADENQATKKDNPKNQPLVESVDSIEMESQLYNEVIAQVKVPVEATIEI